MTNEQLWMVIGAPLLFNGLIFIVISTNMNARLASIDTRLASLEQRVENRFASLEQRMDMMIGAIHELYNRLTRLEERMERR